MSFMDSVNASKRWRSCAKCGHQFQGDGYGFSGRSERFCSASCRDAYGSQLNAGKSANNAASAAANAAAATIAQAQREAAAIAEKAAAAAEKAAAKQREDLEKDHFRPSIEARVGHPLRLDDIVLNPRTGEFVAKTELEAEQKAAREAFAQTLSPKFEAEIIRKADMWCDIDGTRLPCFEWVKTIPETAIEDHKIEVFGPDFDKVESGGMIAMSCIVEVAGAKMQDDFEPVFERKIQSFLNQSEGIMQTGQSDLIRIRVSKAAFDAGFRASYIGEIIYAKIKSEYGGLVDKCQVKIYTGFPATPEYQKLEELKRQANEAYAKRDARLKSLSDESVEVFYTCMSCQSFAPSQVCIVSPDRTGLCGAMSWLDAKANYELDPNGPCRQVAKLRTIDERLGLWEGVNEAVKRESHEAVSQIALYSMLTDPMPNSGTGECFCAWEGTSNGVVIVNREHSGMTPIGMSFSDIERSCGSGIQTPGFLQHAKQFISSRKFLKAEGGPARIVWMPQALKWLVISNLNATAKELYGIDNFADMIADETVCEGDTNCLMAFLKSKRHPVTMPDKYGLRSFDELANNTPAQPTATAQPTPAAAVAFCPNCGTKTTSGIKFCANCGTKVG
jgi:acetyl-CoA synthase